MKVKSMQRSGTEAIRAKIRPSKPKQEITNITNSQNTKSTYGQPSEQLFPKRWPLSNRNRTNFPFLDDDVPRRPSYGVYISQLIRFARVCRHVEYFNARNKCLTAKLLKEGYRYHKSVHNVDDRTWKTTF